MKSAKLTVVNLSPHDPCQQVGRPVHPLYAEPAVQAWSWQKRALYEEHVSSPGPWTRRAVPVEQPSWGPQQIGSTVTPVTAQWPAQPAPDLLEAAERPGMHASTLC